MTDDTVINERFEKIKMASKMATKYIAKFNLTWQWLSECFSSQILDEFTLLLNKLSNGTLSWLRTRWHQRWLSIVKYSREKYDSSFLFTVLLGHCFLRF